MKVKCNIIKDILPLYVENMLSNDSCDMVKEHIETCEECSAELEKMQASNKIPQDTNTSALVKIKSNLRKRKRRIIVLCIFCSLTWIIVAVNLLTSPKNIPYSKDNIIINEIGNGEVLAIFDKKVDSFKIYRHELDDNTGYVYHITVCDSISNINYKKDVRANTVLNPNGENVVAVYHDQTEGKESVLIYGEHIYPEGSVVELPRLALNYYLIINIALLMLIGIGMILFRKKKKLLNFLIKLAFLPLAYILSHFLIKGFSTSTYFLEKDICSIVLVTLTLYASFITALEFKK